MSTFCCMSRVRVWVCMGARAYTCDETNFLCNINSFFSLYVNAFLSTTMHSFSQFNSLHNHHAIVHVHATVHTNMIANMSSNLCVIRRVRERRRRSRGRGPQGGRAHAATQGLCRSCCVRCRRTLREGPLEVGKLPLIWGFTVIARLSGLLSGGMSDRRVAVCACDPLRFASRMLFAHEYLRRHRRVEVPVRTH